MTVSVNALPLNQNDFEAIAQRWQAFIVAWENEDAEACARFYLQDGVNVPPQLPANQGRENIQAFYAWLFSMNQSSVYRHLSSQLHISSGMAVEYAAFEVDWVPNAGDPWTYFARCMVHWVKDEDGLWYISGLYFNTPPQAN